MLSLLESIVASIRFLLLLRASDILEARDIAQPLIVLWFFSGLHEIFANNIVQSNNLPSIITYGNIILLISDNFFNK